MTHGLDSLKNLVASLHAENTINSAIAILVAARKGDKAIDSLPEALRPKSIDAGYQFQEALTLALKEKVVGWKIACTNSEAQKLMETDEPFAGPLLQSMLYESSTTLQADSFNMRMIEGEFAFKLGNDLPARLKPYSRSEVEMAVDSVHPAIEIADSRFHDWLAVGLPSLLADGAVSGALVCGEGNDNWRGFDLVNCPVTMRADGEIVGQGTGAGALGDPVSSLHWLINKRSSQGFGIQAGQIVTTGTCTGNYLASGDCEIAADFGELGEVRVSFRP